MENNIQIFCLTLLIIFSVCLGYVAIDTLKEEKNI